MRRIFAKARTDGRTFAKQPRSAERVFVGYTLSATVIPCSIVRLMQAVLEAIGI